MFLSRSLCVEVFPWFGMSVFMSAGVFWLPSTCTVLGLTSVVCVVPAGSAVPVDWALLPAGSAVPVDWALLPAACMGRGVTSPVASMSLYYTLSSWREWPVTFCPGYLPVPNTLLSNEIAAPHFMSGVHSRMVLFPVYIRIFLRCGF